MFDAVDLPLWNLFLSTIIASEATIIFLLRWTRPRVSHRPQSMIGLSVIALFAYLAVDTALGQVVQHVSGETLPTLSMITFIAIMFRFAIFFGLTVFLWHEWVESKKAGPT